MTRLTRQIFPTPVLLVAALAVGAALTGCDTGDGKELKDFDPADYPAPVVETTVDGAGSVLSFDTSFGVDGLDDGVIEPLTIIAPWEDGAAIDPRNTCDGIDESPALSWGAVPPGTQEIAIAMVDESAVNEGQPFVHWVIGGLDPAEIALVEGDVPPGALQALNFFGDVGYGGPCPPLGSDPHVYRLTAYALGQQLEIIDGIPAAEFLDVVAMLAIDAASVTGTYQR